MRDVEQEWMAAIRRGDLATAWSISDAILAARDPRGSDDPALPYHRRWVWDGRAYGGRHVLVRCYHGLGDTLQFARFLPVLRQRVASLTVETQPELLPLLATIPGPDRLQGFDPGDPAPPSDCDFEIMELSHALRLSPGAAPRPPYLKARAVASPPGSIGLCAQAGAWDPARSVPFAALGAVVGDRPVAVLQPGAIAGSLRVVNPAGCPERIADTAALIAGLDLVVTVDTMIAHLAGALDRPTWLLLPHDADWRWGDARRDTPWYPSMRLYRQPRPGDWGPVLAQLSGDLAARPL